MKPMTLTKAITLGSLVLIGVSGLCALPGSGTNLQRAEAQATSLTAKEFLGKNLYFDTSLSTPNGMSCATCHAPEAGFTYPKSDINQAFGPVPGVIPTRFGFRVPPTIAYAAYVPAGPPHLDPTKPLYVGGLFLDGRAPNLSAQAEMPFQNPNEMNNVLHNLASPGLVVASVKRGPYASLFRQVYGKAIFDNPTTAFADIADAIAAFEAAPEVSPFNSKYDLWLKGQAKLTPDELDGLRLVTGSWTGRPGGPAYYKVINGQQVIKNAQCAVCHEIPADPTTGPDLWTGSHYANVGAPRNPNNPYYKQTNSATDPLGYNPLGRNFVDLGLGDFLYPQEGLPSGNMGPGSDTRGDYLKVNGTFRVPTLRNIAKVPNPGFVKAYMHNGVFKSLKQVVHFYNTRNLTTAPGEVIDFTKADPYAGLVGKPLWPEPEYASPITLQNPSGLPVSSTSRVGNLGLTDAEENHIIAFLNTLSDQTPE
jgi:cytochrome c peroxidase